MDAALPIQPIRNDGKSPGTANSQPPEDNITAPLIEDKKQDKKLSPSLTLNPNRQKLETVLSRSYKFLIAPLCGLSFLSSIASFVSANFLDGENEFLDKASKLTNKGAYFFNGAYSSLDNVLSNNIVGTIGYSLVSVASILGDHENMYQLKGPGSALDQLPALNDCTANNKKIMEKYPGDPEYFNVYKNFKDSVNKTYDSFKVVCSDVCDEYKSKLSKGENMLKATSEIFITTKRYAERHLVISTLAILTGFFTRSVLGFKKLGATIRDIFGMDADTGILATAFSPSVEGQSTASRTKYGFAGGGYLGGGFVDLLYRWAEIPKADLLAVGLDNLGFGFMVSANADSNKRARELAGELKKP